MATRTFEREKQQKSRVQLNSFFVFTYVDNKERVKALVKKRNRILLEEKHENWR